ncbi:MAG: 50S ribosomal protein L13, partial [Deltaproteobacteria bacterium]|nr:50S ribosomal protein L13 [Deltaproteobacteria bacterium]
FVVVLNASKVKLTGNKWEDKKYYHHTGYLGGIKERSAEEVKAKKPEELIELAVRGMLPKNRLSRDLLTKLRIYPNAEHPHVAQQPTTITF